MNNAALNLGVYIYIFKILFSIILETYPEAGLLAYIVILFLIFGGTSIQFSKWLQCFTFTQTVPKSTNISTSSLALLVYCLFDSGHLSGCETISHCGFLFVCLFLFFLTPLLEYNCFTMVC